MTDQHIIRSRGTVVARVGTGRLFIESPEHFYAVGNADKVQLQVGDAVEFEAVFGDQFANVTAVIGRRLP
jgi:hypothetical protein